MSAGPSMLKDWSCSVCGQTGDNLVKGWLHALREHPEVQAAMALYPERTKALQKVRDLIALTASSDDNESRNAAKIACDLIRVHGFKVV